MFAPVEVHHPNVEVSIKVRYRGAQSAKGANMNKIQIDL